MNTLKQHLFIGVVSLIMLSFLLTILGVMTDFGIINLGVSVDFVNLSQTLVVPSLIALGLILL